MNKTYFDVVKFDKKKQKERLEKYAKGFKK